MAGVYILVNGQFVPVSADQPLPVAGFGSGGLQTVQTALNASDAAGGIVSWANPESVDIIIKEVMLYIATPASGACTADIGTTATSGATSSNNIHAGADLHSAAGLQVYSTPQVVAPGKWLTISKASGATSGLVGTAFITFLPASAIAGNGVASTGTADHLARFSPDWAHLVDSIIGDDGSTATVTGDLAVTGAITGDGSGMSGVVTDVTGTAPVASSGGQTPAISMAKADASTDGYLDNADFATFAAKMASPMPVPASAPADNTLTAGTIAFYLDETGHHLHAKWKESGGTVKSIDLGAGS